MAALTGFRRSDGTCGVRNHVFVLPTVVCANQVGIQASLRHPRLKFVEHQHGCAQIGADLEQTRRMFARLAVHPNVYASVLVSLGCEAVVASELLREIDGVAGPRRQAAQLQVIQQNGGTVATVGRVEAWAEDRLQEAARLKREPIAWADLVIAVLADPDLGDPARSSLSSLVAALAATGARLVLPESQGDALRAVAPDAPRLSYGQAGGGERAWTTADGSNPLETVTGLTAAGAQAVIHLCAQPHAFGSVLAPVVRVCTDAAVYAELAEDFDACLIRPDEVPGVIEAVARTVCGEETVAERLGLDDFALYRIGPTV